MMNLKLYLVFDRQGGFLFRTPAETVGEALRGVARAHDIGYAAGWRNCADGAARTVASHIDRLEPGKQRRMRDALLDLLASMRSILVSQRAAKETSR